MPEEKLEETIEEEAPEEESPQEDQVPDALEEYLSDTDEKYGPIDEEVPAEKVSEPSEGEESPLESTTEPEKTAEPKEKTPVEEKAPERDLEDVVEETVEKTLEKAGFKKEEVDEAKDEGFKFAWEERGEDRPASWKEQTEETARFIKWQDDQEARAKRASAERQLEEQRKTVDETNAEWDRQLGYLREKGYIPPVSPEVQAKLNAEQPLTMEDANDPGIKAQRDLFQKMSDISKTRDRPIVDLVHIYHEYYEKPAQKKPAGAKAPVSGGRPAVSQKSDDLSYEDLHKADFEDLLNMPA